MAKLDKTYAQVARADTNGLLYRIQDLTWAFQPTPADAGWLMPVAGAQPVVEFNNPDIHQVSQGC